MAPPPAPFKQVTRPDPERIRRSALKTHNWSTGVTLHLNPGQ
jgi:hypothetical protein